MPFFTGLWQNEFLTRSHHFYCGANLLADSLITDRDIERATQYLVREHNGQAQRAAQNRVDCLFKDGEHEAAAIWSRIATALG